MPFSTTLPTAENHIHLFPISDESNPRPFCARCRRRMETKSSRPLQYRCRACRAVVTHHCIRFIDVHSIRRAKGPTPLCRRCKAPTWRRGVHSKYGQRYSCSRCHYSFIPKEKVSSMKVRRPRSTGGILMLVLSVLPANLPPEIREEAQSAIICDLLMKKVSAPALLDPKRVRRYVREAYGFSNPHRFCSLDAPVSKDYATTFGELLEG